MSKALAIFLLAAMLAVSHAQPPQTTQSPSKPGKKSTGELIEILGEPGSTWIVIEPRDLDHRVYESGRAFVCAAISKTGFVRVLQVRAAAPAEPTGALVLATAWHEFQVGPPPAPPGPAIPPTAKVTATPQQLDAKTLGPVHVEWTTAPEGVSVTLDAGDGKGAKEVAPNGSQVLLPQRSQLVTVAATDSSGITAYSQSLITVSDTPPPPVVDTKSLVSIVYESSEMPVPRQVHNARFALESKGFEVRVVDVDVVAGNGNVPAHMKAAIAAAREQGLPALIVTSGDKVQRKMALPTTDADIVKAVTQ